MADGDAVVLQHILQATGAAAPPPSSRKNMFLILFYFFHIYYCFYVGRAQVSVVLILVPFRCPVGLVVVPELAAVAHQ